MVVDAGLVIKKMRKEKGLSQKETARRAGITASLLSQIENKKTNVSISTLEKIGKALGLPVSSFIMDELSEIEAGHDIPVIEERETVISQQTYDPVAKKGMRPVIQLSGAIGHLEMLTMRVNRILGAYKKTLEKNQSFDGLQYFEPVEQVIYVSSGSLKVQLDSGEYYLNPGYSINFDQDNRLKKITSVSNEPSVFLLFSSPPIY